MLFRSATFNLEDPSEYFQTDIMARQTRALNRACWGAALRKPAMTPEARKAGEVPATPAGGGTAPAAGATPSGNKPPPLLGPNLTPEEMARANAHAPRTKDGAQVVCWDAGTHRGCHTSACRNAHVPLGKPTLLDATVQMQLARRGGVKSEKKLDAAQATQRIQQLRDGMKAKAASDRAPPGQIGRAHV